MYGCQIFFILLDTLEYNTIRVPTHFLTFSPTQRKGMLKIPGLKYDKHNRSLALHISILSRNPGAWEGLFVTYCPDAMRVSFGGDCLERIVCVLLVGDARWWPVISSVVSFSHRDAPMKCRADSGLHIITLTLIHLLGTATTAYSH